MNTFTKITTNSFEIIYEGNNDKSRYIPSVVQIKLAEHSWFTFDQIELQDIEKLIKMRQLIRSYLNPNMNSNLCTCGTKRESMGIDGDNNWWLSINSTGLHLNVTVIANGNGCDVNIDVPFKKEHVEIFDMLIELRNCIDSRTKYTHTKC